MKRNTKLMHKFIVQPLILASSSLLIAASVAAEEEASLERAAYSLEEIVVTARKRTESVQDVPISIAAHTGEMLEVRQIDSTDKLGQITPNLQFSSRAASSGHNSTSTIFMRGVGQIDFLSSNDSGVGFYLDEVYYSRSVGTSINFLDIDRVEILRGPQGTLFGRNTIGGAIQLFSNRPSHAENSGKLSLNFGRFDRTDIEGMYNLAVSDRWAFRLAAAVNSRDGYVERASDGKDLGDINNFIVRFSASWQPADNFSANLVYDRIKTDENGTPTIFNSINTSQAFPVFASLNAGCSAAVGGPPGVRVVNETASINRACANNAFQALAPYSVDPNGKLASELKTEGLSLTMEWNVSDNFNVKYIASFKDIYYFSARDADNTPLTILHTENSDDVEALSQELQFQGELMGGRLQWLLGAYYYGETASQIYPAFLPSPQVGTLDNQAKIDNKTVAIFTQESFSITDSLELTVGARWTQETKEVTPFSFVPEGEIYNAPDNTGANPGCAPGKDCLRLLAGDFLYERNLNKKEVTEMTPMLSLRYHISEDTMLYTRFSKGFKSGGFVTRLNTPLPELPSNPTGREFLPEFDPEFVTAYELGIKSSPVDNLKLNGAIYLSNYSDMQIVIREGITPIILNAGAATIKGLEFDFTYLWKSVIEMTGGVGYTDFEYESFSDALISRGANSNLLGSVDLTDTSAHTPEWTANIGIAYIHHATWGRLTSRLDWSYKSKIFFDAPNTEAIAEGAINLLHAGITYRDPSNLWNVTFSVSNLTDKLHRTTGNSSLHASSGYAESVYAPPREWSLKISREF